MYRVFIVDDEPIIREGLKKIIDWENNGFRIVGTAGNGIDGYRKIISLSPHLCLIDIKMPGIDGLTLIQKIKQKLPGVKIIILTGYPEFEYARKAIDLGVESYLLKPIDPQVLLEKTKKIYEELEKERVSKEFLDKSIELSKDKIIENFLKGYIKDLSQDKLNDLFNFNFPWKSYQVVLISPKSDLIVIEIKNIFSHLFFCDDYLLTIVRNFSRYKEKVISFRNSVKNKYNISITISVGEKVLDWKDLPVSYCSALNLLKEKFLYGYRGIIYPHGKQKMYNNFDIGEDKIVEELVDAIENCNIESINEILEQNLSYVLGKNLSEDEIRSRFVNIYINVINSLLSRNIRIKDLIPVFINSRILKEFDRKEYLLELNNFMRNLLCEFTKNYSEIVGSSLISKVLDYIESNYYKDLKLKEISRLFGYNSCYFGKIFRRYTGESFNTFLDKIRINKAKEMIIQGMKISEIAEKVGYKDIDYFLYKFKKYTGKSPKNYKEEIINLGN